MFKVNARTGFGPYFLAGCALIQEPVEVIPVEHLVPLVHFLPLLLGHVSDVSYASDHEVVDPEEFRYLINDVGVQSVDRSTHHDNRRNADDDSDKSEKRTQFVRENRLKRDLGSIQVERVKTPHSLRSPCDRSLADPWQGFIRKIP